VNKNTQLNYVEFCNQIYLSLLAGILHVLVQRKYPVPLVCVLLPSDRKWSSREATTPKEEEGEEGKEVEGQEWRRRRLPFAGPKEQGSPVPGECLPLIIVQLSKKSVAYILNAELICVASKLKIILLFCCHIFAPFYYSILV
jgi:hypothetical protein